MCTTKYAHASAKKTSPNANNAANANNPINCPKTGVANALTNHVGMCIVAWPSLLCHSPNDGASAASPPANRDAYKSYAARSVGVVSVECALVTTAIASVARASRHLSGCNTLARFLYARFSSACVARRETPSTA
jgi:hypothetical protein